MRVNGRWLNRVLLAVVGSVGLLVVSGFFSPGMAQENGDQSTKRAVEAFHGPVMGSNRLVGMGGAYVGVAQGAYAHFINPASLAVRYPYTKDSLLDWDFLVAWMSGTGENTFKAVPDELDKPYSNSTFLAGGVNTKVHMAAVGAHGTAQRYTVRNTDVSSWRLGTGAGVSLGHGKFQIGGMAQLAGLSLFDARSSAPEDSELASFIGAGYLIGALYSPKRKHYRIGASFRSEISGNLERGNIPEDRFGKIRPKRFISPWQLRIGGSYHIGDGRYNPHYTYGVDTEHEELGIDSAQYLLISGELVLTGSTGSAIGLESYIMQQDRKAGQNISLEPRLGLESEVIGKWLRLRAGTYYEPNRYERWAGRLHGTGGFEVKVPVGLDFSVSGVADLAKDYMNYGISIGLWHEKALPAITAN